MCLVFTMTQISLAQATIEVNARAEGKSFRHFWSKCVGAGRANEGLRAGWLEHLQLSKDLCGFEYVRFHGLFHDDMFVYREKDGKVTYNWQYIDDLFDRMLAMGVRPFVELSFCPGDMKSNENATFWWKGNTSPPKDYAKWTGLVSAFTQHCIDRYGLDEVRQWYFEVWNEPNLGGFWKGTKSQYFELYKVSAQAIKTIDKKLRVGGPSTSNFVPDDRFAGEVEDRTKHTTKPDELAKAQWRGVWIEDFLEYCKQENLPVDFVSTHPYPTDWAIDLDDGKWKGMTREVGSTRKDILWLRKALAESACAGAEIHLTEWNSSPSPRDRTHDYLQEAAFIIKVNLDCIGLTDSLAFWTFTDVFEEKGAGDTIFHGGFGLINYQGIVKPSFHAYRMLHALGNEILYQDDSLIVTRDVKTRKITALFYHYPSELKTAIQSSVDDAAISDKTLDIGTPREFSLKISGLPMRAAFEIETLDSEYGYAFAAWKAMGSPEPPTRQQTNQLKTAAMATHKENIRAGFNGILTYQKTLASWTVVLMKQK
jgi:xylan 1,4-beta-xylosidase